MMAKKQKIRNFSYKIAIYYACLVFLIAITTIIYWNASYALKIDFTSFYLTIYTVWHGNDPYHGVLTNHHISLDPMISPNLNPPITLLLFTPFQWLPYPLAYLIFTAITLILGLIAANTSIQYFLESPNDSKTRLLAMLTYFASFPVLLNMLTGQFGAILFFLIMLGYHGYRQNRPLLTVGAWGLAISMKFFAGLLIIFCMQQRRFRLTVTIVMATIIISMLPALIFGAPLYLQYLKLMQSIYWYDASWNASFLGFLSKSAGFFPELKEAPALIKKIWFLFSIIAIVWYGTSQSLKNKESVSFAICLVLMIALSPLGWVYYFSILMPALLLSYQLSLNKPLKERVWLGCLIMLTFPMSYLRQPDMSDNFLQLSLYSVQFYGLCLLFVQLVWGNMRSSHDKAMNSHQLFWPIYIMLFIGLIFLFAIAGTKAT